MYNLSRVSKPIAGYVRVSSVGSRSETLISPEEQSKRIKAYAKAHSLVVEMAEPELDVSGSRQSRPVLDRLIAEVEAGVLGGIIVAQLDRFSRMHIGDALRTIERIEAAGGRVIAVAENFDEATPEGRLARTVFLGFAQMQLDRLSESFERSKLRALEHGIYGGPVVPFGYKCKRRKEGGTGKLEINRAEAKQVKKAFEARAKGASWREVAEILGRDSAGAGKIIRNRIYLGELRVGDLPPNTKAHPAIVTRELWEAAQIKHPRPPRGDRSESALLAGIVKCAACSRTMAATGNSYRCKRLHGTERCPDPAHISARAIEDLVERSVLAEMQDVRAESVASTSDLETAKADLAAAEQELADFTQATKVAGVGIEAFADALRDRSSAVDAARQRLGEIQALGSVGEVRSLIADWPSLTSRERNQLLRASIGGIWVKAGRKDFANRIKICDPLPNTIIRGQSTPIITVDWNDLPVSVPILSTEHS